MFRRLLVAVDGSSSAQGALDEAIDLAQATHGRLTVVTVAPEPLAWSLGASWAPVDAGDLEARVDRACQATLAAAVEAIPAEVPVTTVFKRGAPAPAIIEVAGQDHDLVLMGSRGHGDLHSLMLGSVSRRVLHASPVPVLVVRRSASTDRDDVPSSLAAVETDAARLARA